MILSLIRICYFEFQRQSRKSEARVTIIIFEGLNLIRARGRVLVTNLVEIGKKKNDPSIQLEASKSY